MAANPFTRRSADNTESLVKELIQLSGKRSFLRPVKRLTEIIHSLGSSGDVTAVRFLMPFLADDNPDIVANAATGIQSLLGQLVPANYFNLDEYLRSGWRNEDSWVRWYRFDARDLAQLPDSVRANIHVLGVLSSHGNGFVREAALRLLAAHKTGEEVPYLLVRLNDWVPQVRNLARTYLLERLTPEYASHFGTNIALLFRLKERQRQNHAEIVDWILTLLRKPECQAILAKVLDSSDRVAARCAYRLLLSIPSGNNPIIQRALRAEDGIVRLWAFREARDTFSAEEFEGVLATAVKDRFSGVRREALYALVEKKSSPAMEMILGELLFDRSAGIRYAARFYLKRIAPRDFVSVYSAALDSRNQNRLSIAIEGVSEVGAKSEATALLPYLDHPHCTVRRVAVKAVAKMDGETYVGKLLDRVFDEHPGVAREARTAVVDFLHAVDRESLWKTFRETSDLEARRRILQLLNHTTRWERLGYIVEALMDDASEISAMAKTFAGEWLPFYSYQKPTPEERDRLDRLFENNADRTEPVFCKLKSYYVDFR